MLFARLLRQGLRTGDLTIIDAHGRHHRFGDGGPPRLTIALHDPALHWQLFADPWLKVGEAFMDGSLTIEEGGVEHLVDIAYVNDACLRGTPFRRLSEAFNFAARWSKQHNPAARARRNVARHYDLSYQLFRLFLDADMQYSCGYFRTETDTLDQAQAAKKRHIAAKLLLRPGLRVLDIGSGWGGLALYLAAVADVEVTGITLSEEQHKGSEARAKAAGLAHRVRFVLQDYRRQTGRFDRIVSVGMFEHVGVRHYPEFFRTIENLLTEEGVALVHSIGRRDGPGTTNAWLAKYIFPGGYVPAVSEVLPAVERTNLWVTDIEVLRLHYALTLRHWRDRFNAHRDQARDLYDERFCRMWELYLVASELAFRHSFKMVFQMQLGRTIGSLPICRDYMEAEERRLSGGTDGRATLPAIDTKDAAD